MTTVAIDGPAGSGKSTVARALAAVLGCEVLDTGAMYRAVAFAVLDAGIDPQDHEAVARVARSVRLRVAERVHVDGTDVTGVIRGPEVTATVSIVAANPLVRQTLVERQRAWVRERDAAVVEGRDIGTVVLPDATVKVFLTARPEVRAERRLGDEAKAERTTDVVRVAEEIARRDEFDSTRPTSPLQPAPDAEVLDTSDLGVEEVVRRILARIREVQT